MATTLTRTLTDALLNMKVLQQSVLVNGATLVTVWSKYG